MQKVSFRKLSILGVVLMAASAVTAAILPNKTTNVNQANSADNGTLRSHSNEVSPAVGLLSCVADAPGDLVFSCHITANSSTSGLNGASEAVLHRTAGNTSNSDGTVVNADTTSVVS